MMGRQVRPVRAAESVRSNTMTGRATRENWPPMTERNSVALVTRNSRTRSTDQILATWVIPGEPRAVLRGRRFARRAPAGWTEDSVAGPPSTPLGYSVNQSGGPANESGGGSSVARYMASPFLPRRKGSQPACGDIRSDHKRGHMCRVELHVAHPSLTRVYSRAMGRAVGSASKEAVTGNGAEGPR
jgi:hypothetical protein